MYVHLGLIGKRIVDFLLVLIEHFTMLVTEKLTAEAVRAKIDQKSAISLQRGSLTKNFRWKRTSPTNNFCIYS